MRSLRLALATLALLSLSAFDRAHAADVQNVPDAPGPTTPSVLPDRFDPKRNALEDLQSALLIARREHKRILIDLGGDWCEACHELDQFFSDNPDLRQQRDAAFVWLKVNYSDANKNDAMVKKLPWFIGYPHWFVLDENGNVLSSSFAQATRPDFQNFLIKWAADR